MTAYIYIHGTNHEAQIGERASHGCVRMRNADMASSLFGWVTPGTEVHRLYRRDVKRARQASARPNPTKLLAILSCEIRGGISQKSARNGDQHEIGGELRENTMKTIKFLALYCFGGSRPEQPRTPVPRRRRPARLWSLGVHHHH